jgi:hypothetical protein
MSGILEQFFDTSPEAKFAKKLGISKQDLEAVFNDFDKDGSGTIDANEMEAFAGSLGLFWGGRKMKEIVDQMDTDKSGSIDLKEFATWFCEKGDLEEPRSESEALRHKLMFKVIARKVSKLISPYLDASTGVWCSNKLAVQTGDWDTANPRGMLKAYFCPSTSSELEGLKMPEGAKMAAFVDVSLREGVEEEKVTLLAGFLNQVFDVLLRPTLNKVNSEFKRFCNEPESLMMLPGLCNSKCPPFHSFKVRKQKVDGEEVLRCIAFSAMDPLFLYKESGLNPGQFLPSIMGSFTTNHTISDFLNGGQTTLKDWAGNGRLELNMSWNTRIIKAMGSLLTDDETMGLIHEVTGVGKKKHRRMGKQRIAGLVSKAIGRVFRAQSISMEMQFNGFEEVAEAMILDVMFPLLDHEMQRFKKNEQEEMPSANWDGAVFMAGRGCALSFPGLPTEEEVHAFVTAVGSISGTDLKSFQEDFYTHAKFPTHENGSDK